MKTREQVMAELEALIDSNSLRAVLDALQEICGEKAEHVQSNWQDSALAKRWTRAGSAVARAAAHANDLEV